MLEKKIDAFIYARLDSSRFPGKVLTSIGDQTLLSLLFHRSKKCNINECYLLTSERKVDDALCNYADKIGLKYIRGDSFDLTKRTSKALMHTESDYFLRLNGDSPFVEPSLINYVIKALEDERFISNIFERTFPYGISVEIVDAKFYLNSLKTNIKYDYLEHTTKHLYELSDKKGYISVKQDIDQTDSELVVDKPEHIKTLKSLTNKADLIDCHYWDILGLKKPNFFIEKIN